MATAVEPVWEQWTRDTILPSKLLTVGDWWALLAHRPYTVPNIGGFSQVPPVWGSVANAANIVDWMAMKLSDDEGIAIAEYQDGTNGFYVLTLAAGVTAATPMGGIGTSWQLVTGGTASIADGSITTAKLSDSSVTSAKIVDGTIATADIAPGAVTSAVIAAGAVGTAQIAPGAITSALIATGAVGSAQILDRTIQSADIATGAVTSNEIGLGAITAPLIANQAVGTAALAPQSVTTPILADKNVTTAKIADAAVTNQQLGQSCVTTWNIANGAIQTIDIADRAITEQQLAPNSVGTPELITAAVTTAKIANLAITNALVNDVAWSKITGAPTALPPSGNASGDLTGTYPGPQIAANAVTTAKIADAQVTDAKIVSLAWGKLTGTPSSIAPSGPATGDLTGTYPGPQIAAGAVSQTKLANASVGTAQLIDANVTDAKIVSLAYSKLTGAPAGLPPTGTAGGSLSGSYPSPVIAAGAVMRSMLGTDVAPAVPPVPGVPNANMIVAVNGTGSGLIYQAAPPATLTPGQVTTLYLNDGAVTTPKIADGAVTTPKIADANVTRAKCATDCWLPPIPSAPADIGKSLVVQAGPTLSWVTPAAATTISPTAPVAPKVGQLWWRNDPDGNLFIFYDDGNSQQFVPAVPSNSYPSGPAGGDLQGNYPSPLLSTGISQRIPGYSQDPQDTGKAWIAQSTGLGAWTRLPWSASQVTGGTLTPTDATKRVVIPGPGTATGVDQSSLLLGSRAAKMRLEPIPGLDYHALTANCYWNGTAWTQESASLASWFIAMDLTNDAIQYQRMPVGGAAGSNAALFQMFGTGQLRITNPNTSASDRFAIQTGNDSTKFHCGSLNGALGWGGMSINSTWNGTSWGADDSTRPQWRVVMQCAGGNDYVGFERGAATTMAQTTPLFLDASGNLTILGPTAIKNTGTTWANPSDPRLKTDMGPYPKGLAEIVQLEPITYHLKSDPDGPLCYGFDASQVQPIFPECVTETSMKLDTADTQPTDGVLSLDIHPILIALVNAVKDLAAKVG